MHLFFALIAVSLWKADALPSRPGKGCVSGRIFLNDSSKIVAVDYEGQTQDPNQFDMTIDYNSNNVKVIMIS
jgi:hypothetical protein